MSEDAKKSNLDKAMRQELHATVKFLTQHYQDTTGNPPTSEELIELLRDRGKPELADEFERIVARVRAERKERKSR